MSSRFWRWTAGAAAGLLVIAVAIAIRSGDADPCPVSTADDALNRQVRLTTTDDAIEFELWSIEPFPTRALFSVVRIGDRDFSSSRYPEDGRLNSLIFMIPHEDFDLLSSEDLVAVYYGGAGSPPTGPVVPDPTNPWNFGGFKKGLLDCVAD